MSVAIDVLKNFSSSHKGKAVPIFDARAEIVLRGDNLVPSSKIVSKPCGECKRIPYKTSNGRRNWENRVSIEILRSTESVPEVCLDVQLREMTQHGKDVAVALFLVMAYQDLRQPRKL